jgi:hypothetical protein
MLCAIHWLPTTSNLWALALACSSISLMQIETQEGIIQDWRQIWCLHWDTPETKSHSHPLGSGLWSFTSNLRVSGVGKQKGVNAVRQRCHSPNTPPGPPSSIKWLTTSARLRLTSFWTKSRIYHTNTIHLLTKLYHPELRGIRRACYVLTQCPMKASDKGLYIKCQDWYGSFSKHFFIANRSWEHVYGQNFCTASEPGARAQV